MKKLPEYDNVFKNLYIANLHKLEYYAYCYLRDREKAKEVVQDVFMILWEKRREIVWKEDTVKYLYVLVKNRCISLLRKEISAGKYYRYSKERELEFNRDALFRDSSVTLYSREVMSLWRNALEQMPDKVRETYLLSKEEMFKNREIAQKLGISLSSVEARLTIAYRILRKELKDYLAILLWFI